MGVADKKSLAQRLAETPAPPALAPLIDEVVNTLHAIEKYTVEALPDIYDLARNGVKEKSE